MSDWLTKQNKQIQNVMSSVQKENAKRVQHQHDAELANISTAKKLQEMAEFMQQEKRDRVESDKKQSRRTWIGNTLMFLTLIVALVALFK